MIRKMGWVCLLAGIFSLTAGARGKAMPKEKNMGAYLLTYFKDDTHSLYFALSNDGYSFTDVNSGKPVVAGDTIAQQKGIRDPHIIRGKDGAFYLAMTDLHLFGKEKGYRSSQWERPDEFGCGNNRGFVLMKSYDLISSARSPTTRSLRLTSFRSSFASSSAIAASLASAGGFSTQPLKTMFFSQ